MKPPHPWRSSGTSSGQDEARDHRWTKGDTKLTVQQRGIKFGKSNKVLDEVNFLTYMLINFSHRTHCSECSATSLHASFTKVLRWRQITEVSRSRTSYRKWVKPNINFEKRFFSRSNVQTNMFDFRLSFCKTKIQSFIVLLKEKSVSNI